jgi:hypothetical protein
MYRDLEESSMERQNDMDRDHYFLIITKRLQVLGEDGIATMSTIMVEQMLKSRMKAKGRRKETVIVVPSNVDSHGRADLR